MKKIIVFAFMLLCIPCLSAADDLAIEYDPLIIHGWEENEYALKGESESQTEIAIDHIKGYIAENPDLKLVLLIEGCASTTGIHPVNDRFGDIRAEQVANRMQYAFPNAEINPISRGQSRPERKVIVTAKFVRDEIMVLAENTGNLTGEVKKLDGSLREASGKISGLDKSLSDISGKLDNLGTTVSTVTPGENRDTLVLEAYDDHYSSGYFSCRGFCSILLF
jgi:hypothetical protein